MMFMYKSVACIHIESFLPGVQRPCMACSFDEDASFRGHVDTSCSTTAARHTDMYAGLPMNTYSLLLMGGYVLFLLRPFLAEIANETRRVAELLSQLPAEVSLQP
jgi:hypothetical protein